MTHLILDIENEVDIRLFLDLAQRLNIPVKKREEETNDQNLVTSKERLKRMKGLAKFEGCLPQNSYIASKNEFYEQ